MDISEHEIPELAARLTPYIAEKLLHAPRYFGDPAKVHVGYGVLLINTMFNLASGHVYIEDYVFFGHNVCVLTGTHDPTAIDGARHSAIPTSGRDIHIERGAWISSNATIVGPCRIGRHAVIGVGSVVIGDVLPGWFYAGVPAKPCKIVVPEVADKVRDRSNLRVVREASGLGENRAG